MDTAAHAAARPALPERTEVAIVGAGPTGLALALTLARAGVDFVLLDRLAEGANTSRAAVVHARTLEVLDALGAAKELTSRGLTVDRFSIREGTRQLLDVPFAGLATPFPYALLVPQDTTEAVLLETLRQAGGDVHRPYEVAGVVQDESGVTLTMATGETLRAAYAVGADGMHSVVREAAGIGFPGGSYGESYVLADVRARWAPGRETVALLLHEKGVALVAPLPDDRFRVVATVDEAPALPDLAFLQRVMDERVPGQLRIEEVRWSSRFRVHHRVADRYRAGRLLLAGDAAHVHSPAGGQGMNTGIQDGHALGRAIAEDRVDTYEALRRPVAERVVAFTDRLTRFAALRGVGGRMARGTLLPLLGRVPSFRTKFATELAELNYR
ncbi:FAD-dependent monooxygenase [Streptantibioticus parmotrematis]|uniref:FAD-dependent monooxygenase n=1 Tax=Streptantibioticus parmotrematis TaxID=2873249 RepID=UPI0033C878B1